MPAVDDVTEVDRLPYGAREAVTPTAYDAGARRVYAVLAVALSDAGVSHEDVLRIVRAIADRAGVPA